MKANVHVKNVLALCKGAYVPYICFKTDERKWCGIHYWSYIELEYEGLKEDYILHVDKFSLVLGTTNES